MFYESRSFIVFSSWSINVIDGLLLIIAHATMSPSAGECFQSNAFYRHIYDSKYVYGVWLIEVCSLIVGQLAANQFPFILICLDF